MINFYSKMKKTKRDKNYPKHMVESCSHLLCIGPTGSGKTNSLINFIFLKNGVFDRIVVFTGSGTDQEPLYKLLKEKIPETEFVSDVEELPTEFDEGTETLVVIDDFINMSKKELKKVCDLLVSGRKKGVTCFLMSQNFTSVPKIISRNCSYILLYKMNDNFTIKHILKNFNKFDIPSEKFLEMYKKATDQPLSFLMIDMKNKDSALRQNFDKCF
jgi:hypothetical protein